MITKLEYQRKKNKTKIQKKSEAHNSMRYPAKLSNILAIMERYVQILV